MINLFNLTNITLAMIIPEHKLFSKILNSLSLIGKNKLLD